MVAVNRVTQGMSHVTDAFTLGRWNEANPPTSVLVTFGSIAQKATFYMVVAKNVKAGNFEGEKMKAISCRDAFPRSTSTKPRGWYRRGMSSSVTAWPTASGLSLKDQGVFPSFR